MGGHKRRAAPRICNGMVHLQMKVGCIYVQEKGIYHNKPNSTYPFWKKEILPDDRSSIVPG